MNDKIYTDKSETYKITVIIQVSAGAFKKDNWIYRALEECLENKEELLGYRMEAV